MSRTQWDPNPPYVEKGGYRKLTVTLPQDVYERLIQESARRKIAGEPNQMLSALLREALSQYLETLDARSGPARNNSPAAERKTGAKE
jgi:transcriptional regulator of met regulon